MTASMSLRFALAAMATLFAVSAHAQTRPLTPQEEARVRALVRETLLQNPEILEEAMIALQEERESERRDALSRLRPELERGAGDYAFGPADAPITIVEFFDYRCGYCKAAADWLFATVRARRDVRVVLKEYPVLGPQSLEASKAALAAMRQGGDRYLRFHQALMAHRGAIDSAALERLAVDAGLDVRRMRRDMTAPEIARRIEQNRALADKVGIEGTPAFLVNGEFVGGYDRETLDRLVREAGARAKRAG